uniref:FACT complex subunit SSRP1 n=1 Tax=Pyxicephalus adspersus TaxID=30357 RepID=A0AAV2ZNV1_PYXAD|nr:TPA: hypothetical protein GDO54_004694 [Pyxicephalus adspersus]
MADTLEFNDIYQEVKGFMNDGRLRLSKAGLMYKNSKTGKVENIAAADLSEGSWRRVALGHGLRLLTRTGHVYKYDGFRESVRQLLSFDIGEQPAFELPLSNVSQCTTGKNEVTLEFHQNDDSDISLMEIRFYVPPTQDDGGDPVEAFAQNVLSKADVIQATGDAVCIFRELQCLTPRGRYDIRIYPTFLHLHGKTFDYKIPYTTVLRLFLLPHKDQRQMFFVEVEKRFEGKLKKNMSGCLYEMVSRVMKALVNRKITVPGNFQGHSGAQCITCSYKASSGLLYPLERGFIYVHKPPVHIRFDEVQCVNFARGTTTTRSFDFEIETKQGSQYTFSSIEREEYGKLFDFVNAKKLNIKNRGLKEEWDRKAEEAKRDYEKALKEYNKNAPADVPKKEKKTKGEKKTSGKADKKKLVKSASPARTPVKTNTVKSKEFVSSDESSSDESTHKKGSDEEMASTPPSSDSD